MDARFGISCVADVVSPIPIGRVSEAWITEFCCTGHNAERSVQGNWIVEVDLIE